MSKWMPPKPDTFIEPIRHTGHHKWIRQDWFNEWWNKEISPLFENAMEVDGKITAASSPLGDYKGAKFEFVDKPNVTHRALLIKIEKIEPESAEDILREMFKQADVHEDGKYLVFSRSLITKAKAYLERKK